MPSIVRLIIRATKFFLAQEEIMAKAQVTIVPTPRLERLVWVITAVLTTKPTAAS